MKHGFVKLAAAVPEIRVASPLYNKEEICSIMNAAYAEGVHVLTFPELALTGATCGDLFFSEKLLADAWSALEDIAGHARDMAEKGFHMLTYVGLPVRCGGKIFSCAAAVTDCGILGITAKGSVTAGGDLDQARHFAPCSHSFWSDIHKTCIRTCHDSLYRCEDLPELTVACCIGEAEDDTGAAVVVHMAASAEIIGREDWRRVQVRSLSGRAVCAVVTAEPGQSESTTDMVFGGHCLIASGGVVLAESLPFSGGKLTTAVVDLKHLYRDRLQKVLPAHPTPETAAPVPQAAFGFSLPLSETDITGVIDPCPFLPASADPHAVCSRILEIQSRGLAKRLTAAHASGAVIALSGGLDSTLALIVTVRAMDILGWDRKKILSVTMPCFGTTNRTRGNAEELALQFGTDFRCVDIKEAVDLHFRDIGHDSADLSVVYENAQARERTQIIMDIANGTGALVIGTGDLSELALGWATYNGDHMSNYGVNGGIPKTLVRQVVQYTAEEYRKAGQDKLAAVLSDILATPVSPELLPPKDGDIAQRTEDIVGPYDLHDFFLYHFVRWGEEPDKIRREALSAFAGRFSGEVIDGWLKIFLRRFFTQQFKRSALPDGPKVGSVALSPRGAWMMPSDAERWEI